MNSVHWAFISIGLLAGGWFVSTTVTGQAVTDLPPDLKSLIYTLIAYATGRQVVKSVGTAKLNRSV